MKNKIMLLALLLFPALSYSQAIHVHPTPTVIDGAKNPELIPDAVAYRHVLLILSTPANPTPEQSVRQAAFLTTKLGLGPTDQIRLMGILSEFRGQHDALVNRFNAQATALQAQGIQLDSSELRQQLDDLVNATRTRLSILSTTAQNIIEAAVKDQKKHTRIATLNATEAQ